MAAQQDEPEPLVGDATVVDDSRAETRVVARLVGAIVVTGGVGVRVGGRVDPGEVHAGVDDAVAPALRAAQSVQGLAPGHGMQPRRRVVRERRAGPGPGGLEEPFLDGLLGEVEVAELPREEGEHPPTLLTREARQGLVEPVVTHVLRSGRPLVRWRPDAARPA